jgi:hypothetical protein
MPFGLEKPRSCRGVYGFVELRADLLERLLITWAESPDVHATRLLI